MSKPGTLLLVVTIAIAVVVPSAIQAGPGTASFSEQAQLPAIRITHAQLATLLAKLRAVVQQANAGIDARYQSEDVEVKNGEASAATLTTDYSEAALRSTFRYADRVTYSYSLRGGRISSVRLVLADSYREVAVEGSAREQVDAVVALVSAQLSPSWSIGGTRIRFYGAMLLMLVAVGVSLLGLILSGWRKYAAIALWNVIQLSLWFLPWDQWLPGFVLQPVDADWMTRNSPLLTFLGTAVTIGATAFDGIRAAIRGQAQANVVAVDGKVARSGKRSGR